jgi:hypothetical protein
MTYSYSGAPLLPPRNGPTLIIPPQPRNPLLVYQPDDDDYERLVDVLIDCIPPDNSGEFLLNLQEAIRIRKCGWQASAGRWRSPTIPWRFICIYPPLHILDSDRDPASHSCTWHPKRAKFHRILSINNSLSSHDLRILDTLRSAPNARLTREQLRHRVSWRITARLCDHLLRRLLAQNYIYVASDGYICLNTGACPCHSTT